MNIVRQLNIYTIDLQAEKLSYKLLEKPWCNYYIYISS